MSHISAIFGSEDDQEILDSLYTIANVGFLPKFEIILNIFLQNTAELGLIHESQSIYESKGYTRSWFAWANSYFAEMLLDLAERKPHLILNTDKPYKP